MASNEFQDILRPEGAGFKLTPPNSTVLCNGYYSVNHSSSMQGEILGI